MSDIELKRKLWALHVGGEMLTKMLQTKVEKEVTIDGGEVVTGGIGYSLTLHHMICIHASTRDAVLEELIPMLPSLMAFSDFLKRIPVTKVTEEEFEFLLKLGHIL